GTVLISPSASSRGISSRMAPSVSPVMVEHLKVLEAIERRSAEDAVNSLVAHINHARDRALRI
ncbi:hypothetical protein ACCS78_21455, partial [Rhizobium johnstonii]